MEMNAGGQVFCSQTATMGTCQSTGLAQKDKTCIQHVHQIIFAACYVEQLQSANTFTVNVFGPTGAVGGLIEITGTGVMSTTVVDGT